MPATDESLFWWASATFRITHPEIDPSEISGRVNATASDEDALGKLDVRTGRNKKWSYWFGKYKIESPNRPDIVIKWAEKFAYENRSSIAELVGLGCEFYVYVGIHANVLAVGFDLPPTPTIWELQIPIGVEFFSR